LHTVVAAAPGAMTGRLERTSKPASVKDRVLCDALTALVAEDELVRARLAEDGSLFNGYHPEMAAVHRINADNVRSIVQQRGWPGNADVGRTGWTALWRIVQHAIGDPDLQRSFLAHLQTFAGTAQDHPVERAMLSDRIAVFEGKPQRYGTQFDWNDDGVFAVMGSLEAPNTVDARRAEVGLGPLADELARQREVAALEGRPADLPARQRAFERWLHESGWR